MKMQFIVLRFLLAGSVQMHRGATAVLEDMKRWYGHFLLFS